MNRHPIHIQVIIISCGCVALTGCGGRTDDLPRQAVSGKVTVNAQPLARGAINFTPASADQPNPVSVGGVVIDGVYSIAQAEGPTPGDYVVTVIASEAGPATPSADAPGAGPKAVVKKKPAPSKKTAAAPLKAVIKESTTNHLDFDVPKE
jgi:hypothetical protein